MPDAQTIQSMLWNTWNVQSDVAMNMRVRRMLVSRDRAAMQNNQTGTLLPAPFQDTSLAIRSMIGEASKAVHIAASRITANQPDIAVIPLSHKEDVSATISKQAGMQERLDAQLWFENGGSDAQWEASWAKSIGGAAFYLTLPRDTDFGLPDRQYWSESDEEIEVLKATGRVSPAPRRTPTGMMIYAEHGDVWRGRRSEAMRMKSVNGRSLFTLTVYPRDMVLKERDREARDLKWAAIVEEIPAIACAPGSDFARDIARRKGIPVDDRGLYGITWDADRKRIIGGIGRGGPVDSQKGYFEAFTLIRFFDREEQVILVAPRATVQGATEIWRGPHGCKVQGVPSCPVVEDPFYRTDINVTGKEYATALDPVFGYVPSINQLMTLGSNIAAFNGIPRWVAEVTDGSTLRGVDGQPVNVQSAPVPGLNPNEIAAYPGTVKQLLINDESLREMLRMYFERLESVMPILGGESSGADAAAWAVSMRIQEGQQPYDRPVKNSCQAISGIVQRWHGWLRQLDVPVYFFAAPGARAKTGDVRGLIEFDPKHLTDSIRVTQGLDTPSEATVRLQIGVELWQTGLIDDEEFFDKYAREQDAREAVIRRWVQIVVNYVMTGALPPVPEGAMPGAEPIVKVVADGVRGQVHYALIEQSENYAWAQARQMAQQAQQPMGQPGMGMPDGSGNVAQAAGASVPGMGMAPTLQEQLGSNVPGGNAPMPVMGA